MAERESKRRNPVTTWVVTNGEAIAIIKIVRSYGFTKMEMTNKLKEVYGPNFIRYFNDLGDDVNVDKAKNKGQMLVTISRGLRPLISDELGGLDQFRKAKDSDFPPQ